MTLWLLLAVSVLGFGCLVAAGAIGGAREARKCEQLLLERQERCLAEQHIAAKARRGEIDATLGEIRALPVYERDGSPHA